MIWILALSTIAGLYLARFQLAYARNPVYKLIPLVNSYASGKPFYLISTQLMSAFPVVNLSGARWLCPLNCLFPLEVIYSYEGVGGNRSGFHRPAQMGSIERWLVETVVSSLIRHPPTILVVEAGNPLPDFDYLGYFAQDRRFAELLTHYSLLGKVERFTVYQYHGKTENWMEKRQ